MGCEHLLVTFPLPLFCFPHRDPRGWRLGAQQWEHSKEQTIRHSLVGWGSGPSSLHLPLLKPVLSIQSACPTWWSQVGWDLGQRPGHSAGLAVSVFSRAQLSPSPKVRSLFFTSLSSCLVSGSSVGSRCREYKSRSPHFSHSSFCAWTKDLATQHLEELAVCSSLSGSSSPSFSPSALWLPCFSQSSTALCPG